VNQGIAPIWKALAIVGLTLLLSCHSRSSRPPGATREDSLLHSGILAPYTDSIRMYPNLPVFYFKRSERLYNLQEFGLSKADLLQAIRLSPGDPAYYYGLGEVYLALEKPDSSRLEFLQAVGLDPGDPQVRLRLADVQFQLDSDAASSSELDTLLQLDPKNAQAHGLRSQILESGGDTARAIAEMETAVKLDPLDFDARMALGDLFSATANPKAVGQYQQAYDLDSTQAEPLYATGVFYEKLHQDDQAIALWKRCILTDHFYTGAYLGLGSIYYQRSDLKQAAQMYQMATQVDPRNAEAFYRLGRCEEAAGKKSVALEDYRQAYSLDRKLAAARDALKRLQ